MNRKQMKKNIAHQIHIHFFIAAMICFMCIMFLALAVYLTYRYMPMPEEETAVLDEEAAEWIQTVDGLVVTDSDVAEYEELRFTYEGFSKEVQEQVTKERYDKLSEAISLAEWLNKQDGSGIVVRDKSRNGYDMSFTDGKAELRERNGKTVFEGQADLIGNGAESTFDEVFNGKSAFTIEAEVNPHGWGFGDPDFNMIASKGDSATSFRISGQKVYFYIKSGDEWIAVEKRLTREQMNSWLHVAAIYDGTDISVYLEGTAMTTTENAGSFEGSKYPFTIGYDQETGRTSTNSIRMLHVYNKALTKEELDQGAYGADSECAVLWYDFWDYTYSGIDTDVKGLRSYTDSVEVKKDGMADILVEPVPYYAEGTVVYEIDNESVASVSEDGILTPKNTGSATVTARVKGTDYKITVPVKVRSFLTMYEAVNWLFARLIPISVLLFGFCVLGILFVQRRNLISYLEKIADEVSFIGKDRNEMDLPPVLSEIQAMIHEVEENFRQKDFAAREAEKRKNDLVVYLAHDLKTPIASMIGYLTLLRDEKQISTELRQHYVEVALTNSERLDDLINEFFEITRFNLSNIILTWRKINLTLLLEQLVSEFEPMFASKELVCSLNVPKDISMRCDAEKMGRVFENLLRNAVNYSSYGTEICIDVTVGENICFTCTNYGETIPKEKLDHIFEQFYRLGSARSSDTGGSGLGLAIAKQIIELHHGEIKAESENGVICFTVTLPVNGENAIRQK